MGKKKGKGKNKGQTPSDDQAQQSETAAPQPSTSQQQPEPSQPESPKPQASGDQPQQPKQKQKKGKQQQKGQQGGPAQPQQQQQQLPSPQQQQQFSPPQQQKQFSPPPQQQKQFSPPPQQQKQFSPPPQPQQQAWRQPQPVWGLPPQQAAPAQRFTPPQQLPPGFAPPQRLPPGFQQSTPQQGPPGFRQTSPVKPPPQGQYGPTQPHWGSPQMAPGQGPQQPVGHQQQQQPGPPRPQQPPQQQQPQSPTQQAPPQQQQQQPQGSRQQQQQGRRPQQQQQQQQGGPSKMPPEQQPQKPQQSASPPSGQGDCLKQLIPVKPGTKGRKILVESNHLELNVGKIMQAVHYDVAITPDTPKALLRDVMNLFREKNYKNRYPAFDGRKNLYSPTMLPFGDTISDNIKIEGENRTKEFQVEIKFARMVDLSPLHDMLKSKKSPQDALQCLDIVLRNAPSINCIIAGRCFFTPPRDAIIPLGEGMEMYYGFYQSAIRGWKPLLNVDVAHKAFPKALEILDLICELGSDYRFTMERKDLGRVSDNVLKSLDKFVKQLKVKYEIRGQPSSKRIYRVNGLGESASKAQFKLENGRTTTVERYFMDVKRVKLNYPNLPTIWVGAKDRDNKILLPIEYCTLIEGQTVNRKMTENQTSAMIKKSATSTSIRKQKIMKSLDEVKYNNDPCIREFGFSINNQFERLDARVLEPPTLKYKNDATVKPAKGVWRADRHQFFIGATIKQWTIASATRHPPRGLESLADQISRMAPNAGMTLQARATQPFSHIGGRQNLQEFIQYFQTKQNFDLIFVVVPNSGPIYSYVKQAAELNVGCLTQCLKERTLNKLNPQTVGNILLKINSKLNGTNHTINGTSRPIIMKRPCMIMGADVTHPSPDAKDIPSVAAVTASHDPQAFQYNICWRLQPPKVEIIEDLCNITKEQLMFFYMKNKCKPETIIFFRDGVSEGQFQEVQRAEISAIQKACKALQAEGYEPKITFLVVQKRHHTRLFPMDQRDSEDRNFNVPAGTCVDTMITNPMMQDFYLVSHASIQGVAKPTKYCTLWDDNKMSHDDIEELTYHLCHMFTRCNRSVSYPAPTYYAHLAAARAKVYIENDKLNMSELNRHQQNYKIKECISKEKPMFFV